MKRSLLKLLALMLASSILLTACDKKETGTDESKTLHTNETESVATTEETQESLPDETKVALEIAGLKDDFYEAVNAEWLSNTVIPADKTSVGVMEDLNERVIKTLMDDFAAMSYEDESNSSEMNEFLKLYEMALDFESRNEDGAEPVKSFLDTIESITDLNDFKTKLPDLINNAYSLPFAVSLVPDNEDSTKKSFAFTGASTFLPEKGYYEDPIGLQLLELTKQAIQDVFVLSGREEEEAAQIAEDAIEFDAILAEYMMSAEDSADVTKVFNKVSFSEYASSIETIDITALVQELINQTPEEVILLNTEHANALDAIISEENFNIMINWMLAVNMLGAADFLSDEIAAAAAPPAMVFRGLAELPDPKLTAYQNASAFYSNVIADYYGRTYFGEVAKQDVTQMVDEIIDVFKERLSNNQWLGEETIDAAIRKLDHMTVNIGYPEEIQNLELFSKFVVTSKEDGGSLYSNVMEFTAIIRQYIFETINEPIDRTEWPMTADTVNAAYVSSFNSITFPAAFLQEPYYSTDYSASQNYGGIGAVIGHEITHAFDTNGSTYDENGNMVNWWTDEDFAAFEELTQAMVEQFDGVETEVGPVNGVLTVSENIADAGGLSCALEIVKNLPDPDLEAFFMNWATVWRTKMTLESQQYFLAADPHAPNKLRVNIQVQNFEEFFETFDIKEGDEMYRAVEDRVSIW